MSEIVADKPELQEVRYANRQRLKGDRGKRLMRRHGKLIERSFVHFYETGAMRRTTCGGAATSPSG